MLFKRDLSNEAGPELTPQRAQEIYALFSAGKSQKDMFRENNVSYTESTAVYSELRKLESDAATIMAGKTPPTKRADLEKLLTSDLLDINAVVTDIIKWCDGKPETSKSFSDYTDQFSGKPRMMEP